MPKQHPADKAVEQHVYMTDDEFAIRTEPTSKDTGPRFKAFIKKGDDEYEVDFSTKVVADVLLYGREITKEQYNKWVRPF